MSSKEIIRVENLTVAFGSFKAVDGISFDVKRGEIFGFLGANGAGKTTTIRTICGLLNPSSGKVFVDGKDVSSDTTALKPHIGYMSQKFTLYKDLTIKENMEFAGALYNMKAADIKKKIKVLADFIKLEFDENSIVADLPGGVKQMVSLCATLLHEPDLVFLDEPTAGVSPQTRADFWGLIKDLSGRGTTVFVTTHYMDEASYCGRIVLMSAGKIVAVGTPEELVENNFPKPFAELVFKDARAVEKIKTEINASVFARAENYGAGLRAEIIDNGRFKIFSADNKNIFEIKTSAPTLEDVFLKLVS
ncbi:MAG: ABC transporter ATP-binding protein [Elusimicrobium sp.]|jgi:ABC-2 type transport system ATP-binding protein|nr:ABC transporter ATP-binding protein [Elusimicrobium sp.]